MADRLRRLSLVTRLMGIAAIVVTAALIAASSTTGAAGPGASADRSVPFETFVGGITPEEETARMAALHERLMKEMPAGVLSDPIRVRLTEQEQSELKRLQERKGGPAVVGRTKPTSEVVRFSAIDAALLSANPHRAGRGLLRAMPDGGFVWALAVVSEGAGAIRVHLDGLNLPEHAGLFFFNQSGQAFGPYTARGPKGNGEFWSNTVFGSEGVILLRHDGPNGAADLKGVSFVISDLGHIGREFTESVGIRPESFCSFNAPCIENASCHNVAAANPAKSAVALMQWVSGAFIFTCTGGLLNDTVTATQIPYFLTANHCISRASDAGNLEAYFQFTLPCGSTNCPVQTNPGGMQRLGATIKATGASGDFTLLQLSQTPPAGSVFLGWNNVPVANTNNTPLHRISHPAWAPQAYSNQTVSTTAPTCGGWPRGERIYSREVTGATEGGSSGSPVVNASSQVVGQLSGACGTNVNDDCDHVNNATVDGALAFYWSSVQPFLDPGTGGCSPRGATCTVNADCCSNKCKGPSSGKTCR